MATQNLTIEPFAIDAKNDADEQATARKAGFFVGLLEAMARHRRYRHTLTELESLSDRELNDLGISRYNIREVAKESVS